MGVDVTANFVRVVFLHHSSGVAGTTDPTTVPVSTNNSSVAQDEEDLNTGARPLNSLLQSPLSPAADLPCGGGHASDRLEFRCPPGVCCAHGNAKAFVDAVLSGELPAVEFKRLDGMSSTSGLPEDLLYRQEEAPEPPGCLQMTSSSKLVDIHSDRYEKHSGDQFVVEEGFAYMEYKSQPPAKNRLERSHESTRGGRSESQTSGSLLSLSEIYFWGLLFEDAVAIIDKVTRKRAVFHCKTWLFSCARKNMDTVVDDWGFVRRSASQTCNTNGWVTEVVLNAFRLSNFSLVGFTWPSLEMAVFPLSA